MWPLENRRESTWVTIRGFESIRSRIVYIWLVIGGCGFQAAKASNASTDAMIERPLFGPKVGLERSVRSRSRFVAGSGIHVGQGDDFGCIFPAGGVARRVCDTVHRVLSGATGSLADPHEVFRRGSQLSERWLDYLYRERRRPGQADSRHFVGDKPSNSAGPGNCLRPEKFSVANFDLSSRLADLRATLPSLSCASV